jgi:hypothetical protein
MRNLRIIVANEPRSYREAISRAIECLRPETKVVEVEPEKLDDELAGFEIPYLVICSRTGRTVERKALSWVELYPDGESFARVNISGVRFEKDDMRLHDLLSAIDQTAFSLGDCEGSDPEKSLI